MFEYIFEGEAEFDDFSLEDLKKVEETLGVKLPDSYIELMKLHNGGDLAYSILHSGRVPDGEVEIENIRGIDLEEGIIESNYLVEEWEMEKGLIIISGDGNYWLSLDYRNYAGNEPAVVYIEEDAESKPKQVAKTFELFLKKLKQPEEDDFEFDLEDDEDEIVYTKEEFEKNISKGKSYVEISNGFYQFAREECDMEWFIKLALQAIKLKKFERLPISIGEHVLMKMNKVPSEKWPINLLTELAESMINFKGYEGDFDYLAVKYGKQIRRKL
ncbi:SMI1/KNR4 family protein [uncultured Rummeliibacillus sp.]|uniref:SMI1/KNR4 family protein n=1 Tax=uncultured Rummeliibacillus sp. TaxID=762292 RepID=UPI00263039DF|nr:SMI1/KNR4 family protein [uncultured Rummeliibacillus sp.]